jgi:thioredoxin reductase (NADPH)
MAEGDDALADDEQDVIIIGGGVAGVNCALECADIQLRTLLFEAGARAGGQLAEIPHSIRNVATGRFENGPTLRDALEESAAILGPRLQVSAPVTRVDLGARWVEVGGRRVHTVHTRAIVLATGTERQELPAAPDGAFGGAVTYQLEPGRPYPPAGPGAGGDVVVIGGGDSGTLDALELARSGSTVKLVHRSATLTARDDILAQLHRQPRIEVLTGWELESLHGAEHLEEVVLRRADGEERRLAARGVVVKIARVPRTALVRDQLALDRRGAIVVDDELRTSRDGVFAAGDVVADAYARVAAALGQGSRAARSVLRYLQGRS